MIMSKQIYFFRPAFKWVSNTNSISKSQHIGLIAHFLVCHRQYFIHWKFYHRLCLKDKPWFGEIF